MIKNYEERLIMSYCPILGTRYDLVIVSNTDENVKY
jgi:hypothetical protein